MGNLCSGCRYEPPTNLMAQHCMRPAGTPCLREPEAPAVPEWQLPLGETVVVDGETAVVATGAERFYLGRVESVGCLDMQGEQLAKHHIQQALLAAEFLPGGEHHGSVMAVIVEQLYLGDQDAADGVRTDLRAALAALGGDVE